MTSPVKASWNCVPTECRNWEQRTVSDATAGVTIRCVRGGGCYTPFSVFASSQGRTPSRDTTPSPYAFVVHCRTFSRRLLHRKFRSVLTIAKVHLCDVSGQPLVTDVGEEGAVQARKSPIDQTLVSLAGAAGLSPNSTSILSN